MSRVMTHEERSCTAHPQQRPAVRRPNSNSTASGGLLPSFDSGRPSQRGEILEPMHSARVHGTFSMSRPTHAPACASTDRALGERGRCRSGRGSPTSLDTLAANSVSEAASHTAATRKGVAACEVDPNGVRRWGRDLRPAGDSEGAPQRAPPPHTRRTARKSQEANPVSAGRWSGEWVCR